MTPDDEYLRRAKEMFEQAQVKKDQYRGDCSDCDFSRMGLLGLRCAHPFVELTAFNLTDDYAKGRIVECGEQRDRTSVWGPVVCGPNGTLFMPRRNWLARLLGIFSPGGGE